MRLATQWQFQEIRNLAIRQLERLDLQPIEKIAIYKRYNVNPELLLPSYITICRKERLPSPEEGKILSMETVLKLASAREQMLLSASESGCKTPTTASTPDDVTKAIIAKLFELTFHSSDHKASGDGSVDEVVTLKQPNPMKGKNPLPELPQNTPPQVSQGNLCASAAADEWCQNGAVKGAATKVRTVSFFCSSSSPDLNIEQKISRGLVCRHHGSNDPSLWPFFGIFVFLLAVAREACFCWDSILCYLCILLYSGRARRPMKTCKCCKCHKRVCTC